MNIKSHIKEWKKDYSHVLVKHKINIALLLTLAVFIILGALWEHHKKSPETVPMLIRKEGKIIIPKDSPLRSKIVIETIHPSSVPHVASFPGLVEAYPSRVVNILPPLPGRLVKLVPTLGTVVKKDEILALIVATGLSQALADLSNARAVLQQTQHALTRTQKVNRAGGNSIKDVQLAQSNYTQAQAEYDRALNIIKILGKNKSNQLIIKAPISGMINEINYGKGSYINDTSTPLMTLSNTQKVFVTAHVPEHAVGALSKNLPAEIVISAFPKQVFHSTIHSINSHLDLNTRRNKTRFILPNPDSKLQLNMFATIYISVPQPNQLIIPVSAIIMNNNMTSVYVEEQPLTFVKHEIELGTEDNNYIRVLSGLKAEDRIVTTGGIFLND